MFRHKGLPLSDWTNNAAVPNPRSIPWKEPGELGHVPDNRVQKFSSIQSFIHMCPFSTKCQCSTEFRTSVTTMNLHQIFITQPDSILRGAIYYWQCEYWCVSLLLWVSIFSSIEVNGEIINYFSRWLWEDNEINVPDS